MPFTPAPFRLSQGPHSIGSMPPPPSAVTNAAIRALVLARAGRQWWPPHLEELARLNALYLEARDLEERQAEYGTAA